MTPALVSLIIFILCIILFVIDKLPMATTAILGCAVMVIAGVCDFKTAFGQFASSTVILTIGVMIIGAAISETGLANTVGRWIAYRSKGSETTLTIGTYLAAALLSAFLTNSAVLAMFIPIIMGLSSADERLKPKNLVMPIVYGCIIGGTSTLVGSTQQLTAQGLLEEAGLRMFKTFDFTPVGGVLVLLGLLYCLFIGRSRGEKIWGDRHDEDIEYIPPEESNCGSRKKQITAALIFAFTVVFYITEWLPLPITSTTAALLCIISGCITQKKAVQSVNWNVVGRLAGCLGLAKALGAAGGTELIMAGFQSIIGTDVSPFLLFCIFVFITQFASEFLSNSTAIMMTLPIVIAIAPGMGLNTYTFALGMTLGSGIGLACPLSSSTAGMSMVMGYRFGDYFKYYFLFDLIAYITIIALVPLIYGLTV